MSYKLDRIGSEKILRDLELKEIHLGRKEGNLTGNVFVDKPWVTKYLDRDIHLDAYDTLYNNYRKFALAHLDDLAMYIPDTGQAYTHREFLQLVDDTMKGFAALGINQDSKIGALVNGSIEEAVTFLACNGLGATFKPINFLKSVPDMKHSAEELDLDMFVMEEPFLGLDPILNEKGVPVVVASTEKEFQDGKHFSFKQMLENGKGVDVSPAPYVDGKITLIISSSGTTGPAKPISHTDHTAVVATIKMLYSDYPLESGNVLFKMLPGQLGAGILTSLYTGLVSGTSVAMIGGMSAEDLVAKMVKFTNEFESFKEKYNLPKDGKLLFFTAPVFTRVYIECPKVQDLSSVGTILAVGSKMSKEELEDLDGKAQAKGCKVPICNGYGQNEQLGAVALNTNNHNCQGSAGYPVIGTDLRIVDPKTHQILGLNQEGLILESTDSQFIRYEGLEEKTKEAFVTLEDGSAWFDTKDLGYLDEDWYLFVTGRSSRVVNRSDFKISLDDYEKKIRSLPFIKDCAAFAHGPISSWENIILNVVLNGPVDNVTEMINGCGLLSEFEFPTSVIVIPEIPQLSGGKVDYPSLKESYEQTLKEQGRIRSLT